MMQVEINQQTMEFVRAHRHSDVRELALHTRRNDDIDVPWALDQIAGWQTARTKLPQWAACDGIIYPPHISMEQCSSEATARYKAQLAQRLIAAQSETVESSPTASSSDMNSADKTVAGSDTHNTLNTEHTGKEPVATDTSTSIPQGSMIDLTGGFGVDFSYMAKIFAQATYVERQQHLCDIAAHNMAQLGLQHVRIVTADAEKYLAQTEPVDVIVVDPARRDDHGSRTYAIADCTPDVLELQDLLLSKARFVIIKLSPMLDWRKAVADFGDTAREVHIVSVANECKELLVVLHSAQKTDNSCRQYHGLQHVYCASITAHGAEIFDYKPATDSSNSHTYTLHNDNNHIHHSEHDHNSLQSKNKHGATNNDNCDPCNTSTVATTHTLGNTQSQQSCDAYITDVQTGQYLYEPHASIMKAGCFNELVQRYDVIPIAANSHLFISPERVNNFPGRVFRIETVSSMSKGELRAALAGVSHANISVRNFPMSVAQLRKKLKIKDGGSVYLFATTTADGRHIVIRTVKTEKSN